MNLFRKITITIFLISAILHFSCHEKIDVITNPKVDNSYSKLNYSSKIELDKFPSIASFETDFKFNIKVNDSNISIKKVNYDFHQDFEYDTLLTLQDTVITKFNKFGYNTVIATVILNDNSELSCSTTVWITSLETLIDDGLQSYEADIFNGNKLAVVHGINHPTQLYDLSTKTWDRTFLNSEEDIYKEMHFPVLSFNTRKLLFDNATNNPNDQYYPFCLYDFDSTKITMDYVPIEVKYIWGKIGFSNDDKNIFYIKEYEMTDDPGPLHIYNLETGDDRVLIDLSDDFCAVPTNPNQVASIFGNTLTIYNISTNSVDAQYDNLPSTGMFRILDDNRIFFKKDIMFYNLETEQIDYIRFDELNNMTELDENDFDITYTGNKLVINEWKTDVKVYIVSLPNNF